MFNVHIEKIKFKSGKELILNNNDIVVFVGPNNCGKTDILNSIWKIISTPPNPHKKFNIINNVETNYNDNKKEDLIAFLEHTCDLIELNGTTFYENINFKKQKADIIMGFKAPSGYADIAPLLFNNLATDNRLSYTRTNINNITYGVTNTHHPNINHPVQKLFLEHDVETTLIEHKIQKYFYDAFGKRLYIRNAGADLHLLYGEPEGEIIEKLKNNKRYIERLKVSEGIPKINEQGDGIKCFSAILLNILLQDYFITIIDEPEAFLHPPQARLIGKVLAENQKGQLFIATHSTDVIQGLLSGGNKNVRIVRITRDGNTNDIKELTPEKINELWSDPFLKHSNAIDGLFYDEVVVCEGYSDNVFYSAVFDAISSDIKGKTPDVFWMNGGGKGKTTKIAKALKAIDIKLKTIVDIDALKDNDVKNIYKALGGSYEDIQQDVENIKNYIKQDNKDWQAFKKQGKEYLDDTTKEVFDSLITKTKQKGLFILEVGELEGFCEIKENGNIVSKERWLDKVLEKDFTKDTELETAKEFIKALFNLSTHPEKPPERHESNAVVLEDS